MRVWWRYDTPDAPRQPHLNTSHHSSSPYLAALQRTPVFVASLLATASCDLSSYVTELSSYLCDAFGNPLRIDYGTGGHPSLLVQRFSSLLTINCQTNTGHETNFAIFGLCLFKLRLMSECDLGSFVLKSFTGYVKVMRKLQSVYFLEPAGSHGV